MNERIKILRKHLSMSQELFGSKLGVSKGAISRIESGINNLTDQMIVSICREYNVNETWIRTGDGEMFIDLLPEDEYFKAATELSIQNDKLAMQAVIEYWKLDDQSKELFRNFIRNIVKNSED